MPNVVTDIIVTPARILYSPVGTTVPAKTVAVGGSWPAGWVEAGFTKEPLKVSYTFEALDIFVEQHLPPVGRVKTKEELKLETVLAELSSVNLDLALDGATAGDATYEEFTVGDYRFLSQLQWGAEGDYLDEDGDRWPIRVFVWNATAVAGGELTLSKSAETGIPLQLAALADLTKNAKERLIKIQRVLETPS